MLDAMVIVFGFMALGYAAQYREETNRSLARLCLYYLVPILIFQSFVHSSVSARSLGEIVLHFFVTTFLVYGLLAKAVGRLFGWRGDVLKWNALAATLANVGYFGLAVVRFALGEQAVPYAVAVSLAFNVYMALFGFAQVGQVADWSGRVRRALTNPYLYAVSASLLWRWCGWHMPAAVDAFLGLAADATLPLTLLLTGAELRNNRLALTGLRAAAQVSALKLFLPVIVAWPLASMLAEDPLERCVMVAMFGMPTSLNLLLLAKDQKRDTGGLALVILLTTLISPITLSILFRVLGRG